MDSREDERIGQPDSRETGSDWCPSRDVFNLERLRPNLVTVSQHRCPTSELADSIGFWADSIGFWADSIRFFSLLYQSFGYIIIFVSTKFHFDETISLAGLVSLLFVVRATFMETLRLYNFCNFGATLLGLVQCLLISFCFGSEILAKIGLP